MQAKVSWLGCACCAAVVWVSLVSAASADMFGTGDNQFTIDFVSISGATNPTSGYGIVTGDYRIGTYEITNDQWDKFKDELGVSVTGNPVTAYDQGSAWTGTNVPTNFVSWCEAAQFVNWLNTSTSHQAAYKFTGTQGTNNYALATWSVAEAAGGTNLYRHKDAFYFLPTEDEWVKAAYWNGTSVQTYATKPSESLTQGDGVSGTGWNYFDGWGYATDPYGPWAVGSGSEELNGTNDIMGNVHEWMESPHSDPDYGVYSLRAARGGSYGNMDSDCAFSNRFSRNPLNEYDNVGFRVASVPEPASLVLLGLGGLVLRSRKK